MSLKWLTDSLRLWQVRERIRKRLHTRAQRDLERARDRDIHPRQHLVDRRDLRSRQLKEARENIARRHRQIAAKKRTRVRASTEWGGARAVTNEIVGIVGNRAPVTSRKRTATYGNPGSDHHVSQVNADAVDFGIANAHWLKNEVSRKMGGPSSLADYGAFYVTRNGKRFRIQGIAGTHGTGPHLHYGVRRG